MKPYYIPTEENKLLLLKTIDAIKSTFTKNIVEVNNINNSATIVINKNILLELMLFLRDNENLLFSQLLDITAIDNINTEKRFSVIYNLLSITNNLRIQILFNIKDNEEVPSVNTIFSSALWLEREVWDLYGILFINHPNLIRLLNDFGFSGHPLRKDFPVTGYNEVYYNANSNKVEYKQLELNQAYRTNNYQNPWLENIEADTFNYLNKHKSEN